jgi:c-di-GMP-binding flagellar brake protein YcgR
MSLSGTPEPTGVDRRQHRRFELLAQVRVKGSKTDLVMTLTNISQGGALVDMGSLEAPSWVDVGRVLEVGIIHPETLDVVDVQARVVRLAKDLETTQLAIEFVSLDDAATARGVDRLIAHASSLPPAARRPGPPPLPGS